MKKFLIVLFILVQGLIFAAGKNLADIKTLKFDVVEKTIIKSKKRELTYKIDFILPNKIKKEVIAPKLNKGEIYMYDYSANKKSVYLPMFNETKESEIVDDENRIIKAINKIIEEEKTNKNFKQKYNAKKEDTEGIVEKILSYYEASVSLFLREEADGKIKGSMRSKYEINVNEVASLFGGGGHYKAAGFSSNLSANEILEIVLKNI